MRSGEGRGEGRTCFVDRREPFPSSRFYTGSQERPSRLWRKRARDGSSQSPAGNYNQDFREDTHITKFGTWDGVFASCLLNIFGVIMFLRLGWVVGEEGVFGACLIIFLSTIVTTLTTLSMSAIATNGEVKAGGAYYLISRALGPASGGSVGVLFWLGNAIACAMYVLGFVETLTDNLGTTLTNTVENDMRVFGALLLTIILVVALIGVGWIIKMQFALLFMLTVSLISFFIGSLYKVDTANEVIGYHGWTNGNLNINLSWSGDVTNFFDTFAVFFPAVTGIMAGANLSGSLEDPSKNIPDGTLTACWVSTIVYVAMAFICGAVAGKGSVSLEKGLVGDYLIMADISCYGPLIYVGIYVATLSSALSALVGAPRVLQSVASDNLFPILNGFKKMNLAEDPERGYFLTYFVALGCVMFGDLNAVAPLITMFYMITYAMINFACFELSISRSPGWRPYFKYYSKWTAMAGFIVNLAMMIFINPEFAAGALCLTFALHQYVKFSNPPVNWGVALDARRHMKAMERVRLLRHLKPHVKNYRPGFLVLIKDQKHDQPLCDFIQTMKYSYGTDVFVNIIESDFHQDVVEKVKKSYKYLSSRNDGFLETLIADNLRAGAQIMMQVGGLGRLRPNTLVMGFPERWFEGSEDEMIGKCRMYQNILHDALLMDHGFMLCRNLESIDFHKRNTNPVELRGYVDVWWLLDSGGLSLLVPHLMSLHSFWRQRTKQHGRCPMRLFLVSAENIGSDEGDQRDLDDYSRARTSGVVMNNLNYDEMWVEEIKKLLRKLRMDFGDTPIEIRTPRKRPTEETLEDFRRLCKIDDDEEIDANVMNWLRVSELIYAYSKREAAVYVSAPFPDPKEDPVQYMGMLDMCSNCCKDGPVILIRGAEKNVVTTKLE